MRSFTGDLKMLVKISSLSRKTLRGVPTCTETNVALTPFPPLARDVKTLAAHER
jgi:hypothetical protein